MIAISGFSEPQKRIINRAYAQMSIVNCGIWGCKDSHNIVKVHIDWDGMTLKIMGGALTISWVVGRLWSNTFPFEHRSSNAIIRKIKEAHNKEKV